MEAIIQVDSKVIQSLQIFRRVLSSQLILHLLKEALYKSGLKACSFQPDLAATVRKSIV
ncbi:MAG: hypothetical protein ACRCVL_03020 [Cetobacterium sp.]